MSRGVFCVCVPAERNGDGLQPPFFISRPTPRLADGHSERAVEDVPEALRPSLSLAMARAYHPFPRPGLFLSQSGTDSFTALCQTVVPPQWFRGHSVSALITDSAVSRTTSEIDAKLMARIIRRRAISIMQETRWHH